MSDSGLKVTDKRMFTPDGELREEYLRREEASGGDQTKTEAAAEVAPSIVQHEPEPPVRDEPSAPEPPPEDEDSNAPQFSDLVRLLAENASIYLSESQRGDPQTAQQHLDLARLHIDMLGVLQTKTQGNLTAEEHTMLESVVYQLRSGFVGIGG